MARLSFVVTLPLLCLLLSFVDAGSSRNSKGSKGSKGGTSSTSSYPTSKYTLVKDFKAGTSEFFDYFDFFTGADPTDGDVK